MRNLTALALAGLVVAGGYGLWQWHGSPEEQPQTFYRDADMDGFGKEPVEMLPSLAENDPFVSDKDGDCDDMDATMRPGATEFCDNIDNDCDGEIDEGLMTTWYPDLDGDGFANPDKSIKACEPPGPEWIQVPQPKGAKWDCDDDQALVHPTALEICGDDEDNDCDGIVDNALPVSMRTASLFPRERARKSKHTDLR